MGKWRFPKMGCIPIAGWFIMEHTKQKWMRTGGSPTFMEIIMEKYVTIFATFIIFLRTITYRRIGYGWANQAVDVYPKPFLSSLFAVVAGSCLTS